MPRKPQSKRELYAFARSTYHFNSICRKLLIAHLQPYYATRRQSGPPDSRTRGTHSECKTPRCWPALINADYQPRTTDKFRLISRAACLTRRTKASNLKWKATPVTWPPQSRTRRAACSVLNFQSITEDEIFPSWATAVVYRRRLSGPCGR